MKIIKYYIILILGVGIIYSCSDQMETIPLEQQDLKNQNLIETKSSSNYATSTDPNCQGSYWDHTIVSFSKSFTTNTVNPLDGVYFNEGEQFTLNWSLPGTLQCWKDRIEGFTWTLALYDGATRLTTLKTGVDFTDYSTTITVPSVSPQYKRKELRIYFEEESASSNGQYLLSLGFLDEYENLYIHGYDATIHISAVEQTGSTFSPGYNYTDIHERDWVTVEWDHKFFRSNLLTIHLVNSQQQIITTWNNIPNYGLKDYLKMPNVAFDQYHYIRIIDSQGYLKHSIDFLIHDD